MTLINLKQPSMNLHTDDRQFCHSLFNYIFNHLPKNNRPIIVLCIGTDRSTGDSLGPLVGYFVKQKPLQHLKIYGCLDIPIHAKNLHETVEEIHQAYQDPFIIAVDAALSSMTKVKTVDVGIGPLTPGAAVKKTDLKPVGQFYIKGYVNISGFMEFSILQNTRLSTVMKMAKQIAQSLYYVDIKLNSRTKFQHPSKTSEVIN